jgi:hypothetical protein
MHLHEESPAPCGDRAPKNAWRHCSLERIELSAAARSEQARAFELLSREHLAASSVALSGAIGRQELALAGFYGRLCRQQMAVR